MQSTEQCNQVPIYFIVTSASLTAHNIRLILRFVIVYVYLVSLRSPSSVITRPTMKAGFRNTQWDPIILVSQIAAMQSLLYVSLGAIMFVMDCLAGANHTLDHLFQYHVCGCIDGRQANAHKAITAVLCLADRKSM